MSEREQRAESERVLAETRNWLEAIVVGLNLCPFAKEPLDAGNVRFLVSGHSELAAACFDELAGEYQKLDVSEELATTLIIYPRGFADWEDYLDLVDASNDALFDLGYEGIYQLASFHPAYQFAGTSSDDAGNLSNRSPYPMLHILRESAVEASLQSVAHPENIPKRNEALCRRLGHEGIRKLLAQAHPPGDDLK